MQQNGPKFGPWLILYAVYQNKFVASVNPKSQLWSWGYWSTLVTLYMCSTAVCCLTTLWWWMAIARIIQEKIYIYIYIYIYIFSCMIRAIAIHHQSVVRQQTAVLHIYNVTNVDQYPQDQSWLFGLTEATNLFWYTAYSINQGPNLGPFCCMASHFEIQRCQKSEKKLQMHGLSLNAGPSNVPHIDKVSTPRGLNLCLFCSMTSRFRDARLLKIGTIRNVPNDVRLTLNS